MTDVYRKAVERTFIGGLRSVFLVDDAFPTFADLYVGGRRLRRFKEIDRAVNLYRSFRKRHLPCDVENTFRAGDLQMVERMRKCDLIVLDLHLDKSDSDPSRTLNILRRLAESDHFNTVVLYTKKPELNDVWLDVAANLRPDLCDPSVPLRGLINEEAWWGQADLKTIDPPSENALAAFLLKGPAAIGAERKRLLDDLRTAGASGNLNAVLDAFLRYHANIRQVAENVKLNKKAPPGTRHLQGRFDKTRPYWLQCDGCFIAIVNKAEADDGMEADYILDRLRDALLDWKPNFLQMLISEIQNRLELEALATDSRSFSDPTLQAGLSHYLLELLAEDPEDEAAVETTIDRVVETIRHKISGDKALRKFARGILADRREALDSALKNTDPMHRAAAFAHIDTAPDSKDVLFFLNSFLSTETFNRSRLTTGTVFYRNEQYWMVMSPACDLTGRKPKPAQPWVHNIHPIRAVIALRAKKTSVDQALKSATQGRSAFLKIAGENLALNLFYTDVNPVPEVFFAENAGKVTFSKAGIATFRGAQVFRDPRGRRGAPKMEMTVEFEIVGQLRANYASRVLQFTGSHLGRIGVDFFNSEVAKSNAGSKKKGQQEQIRDTAQPTITEVTVEGADDAVA